MNKDLKEKKRKADKRLKKLVWVEEIYKSPEWFRNKIDKYFENCLIHKKIPTIYGLRIYIWYNERLLARRKDYLAIYTEASLDIKWNGTYSLIVRLYPTPSEFEKQIDKFFNVCDLEDNDYRYTSLLLFLKLNKKNVDTLLNVIDPNDIIADYVNIIRNALLRCEDDLVHKAQKWKTQHWIAIQELRQKIYNRSDKQVVEHSIDWDSFSQFFKELQSNKQDLLEWEIVEWEIII